MNETNPQLIKDFSEAEKLFNEKKYQESIKKYEIILKKYPNLDELRLRSKGSDPNAAIDPSLDIELTDTTSNLLPL